MARSERLNFLQGLHGVVALVLLCSLLFAEEAGVPLPFAPGELTLIAGGLLVASGGLNPFAFVPLAIVACVAGSIVGYGWARLVGERGLGAVARRLRQQKALDRVSSRVRSAGWFGVAVCRLIPGLRIYTTLVAGAVQVQYRTFLIAMASSTVLWVVAYVALGAAVGIPVEHFFNQVQQLAVQGAILIVMGVGVYLTIRRTPPSTGAGLVRVPRLVRALIAAAIDLGVIAAIVTGLLALGRRLFGVGIGAGWLDAVIAVVVAAVVYIVVARRGVGGTIGEALLQTSYVSGRRLPRRPQEAWQAARQLLAGSPDELRATAELLGALADPHRLRLVRHLLDSPRTAEELATLTGREPLEVRHQLDRLQSAGVLAALGTEQEARWRVRPELVTPLLEFLSASQWPPAVAPEPAAPLPAVPRPEGTGQ